MTGDLSFNGFLTLKLLYFALALLEKTFVMRQPMKSHFFAVACLCSAGQGIYAQVEASRGACGALLDHGISNVFYQTGDYSSAVAFHREFCRQDYESMTTSKKASAKIAIGKLPVGLTGSRSSDRERFSHFCNTYEYDRNTAGREVHFASELYGKAVEAWLSCVALNSTGMVIQPQMASDRQSVDFEIWKQRGTGKLTGVVTQNMSCSRRGEDIGPSDEIELDGDVESIRCIRESQNIDFENSRGSYYPSANVKVVTNEGDFRIDFPEMFEGPARDAFARLETQILALAAENRELRDRLSKGISSIGQAVSKTTELAVHNPKIAERYKVNPSSVECPPGTYVSGINASEGVSGKYATDGIKSIRVTCTAVKVATTE